jgi:molecular chaperone DnaK
MKVLADTHLEPKGMDKIILIGGMTRMPLVRKFVEDIIGKPAETGVDPMECVAVGAAIQGSILGGETHDILLLDVTPLSLGIEILGRVMTGLIERNTTIPTRKS